MWFSCNLTRSHRESDNSPLLIVFSANYIDQSSLLLCDWKLAKQFHLKKYCTAFKIHYLIGRNHDAICKYKVHLNMISNVKLSDPLCNSINRDLTLVRLGFHVIWHWSDNAVLYVHFYVCGYLVICFFSQFGLIYFLLSSYKSYSQFSLYNFTFLSYWCGIITCSCINKSPFNF